MFPMLKIIIIIIIIIIIFFIIIKITLFIDSKN